MNFNIISTSRFDKELNRLSQKDIKKVYDKVQLIKKNPYRFKALTLKRHKLFRIRLNFNKKEMRLIYKIVEPNVILICFLNRSHDYRELRKILNEI